MTAGALTDTANANVNASAGTSTGTGTGTVASRSYRKTSKLSRYKLSNKKVDTSSRHTSPIIIELGSAFIRVGIAGEAQPRCIFPASGGPSSTSSSSSSSSIHDPSSLSFVTTPPLPASTYSISKPSGINTSNSNNSCSSSDTTDHTIYYHSHLSPFLHNLYTNHLYIKPKSKRVIILLPTQYSYSTTYKNTIQDILLNELNIPCIKFVNNSSLYTPLPFALGKNAGLVIDVGHVEGRIGVYFDKNVLADTICVLPIGMKVLIDKVCHDLFLLLSQQKYKQNDDSDITEAEAEVDNENTNDKEIDHDTIQSIQNLVEDILINNNPLDHPNHDLSTSSNSNNTLFQNITNRQIQQIINNNIQDLYFNINNPHSLIHAFLSCIIDKCPIDLRCEIIKNICFIGGTLNCNCIPNFEKRFLNSVLNLFEKKRKKIGDNYGDGDDNDDDIKHASRYAYVYAMKNEYKRHGKFQSLARLIMEKGPMSCIYPLPFSPSCMNWIGGSVLGSLNDSNAQDWIYHEE